MSWGHIDGMTVGLTASTDIAAVDYLELVRAEEKMSYVNILAVLCITVSSVIGAENMFSGIYIYVL